MDEDYDPRAEGATEEEEEWVDPVDIEELLPGPSTIFVGGFSKYKTINDALDAVMTSNDRIVVLDSQDGDVIIDAARYAGVTIVGSANPANQFEVKAPKNDDEEDGGDEGDMDGDEADELGEDEDGAADFTAVEKKRRKALKQTIAMDPNFPERRSVYAHTTIIRGQLILKHSEVQAGAALPTGFPIPDEDEDEDETRAATGGVDDEDGEGENAGEDGGSVDGEGKGKRVKVVPRVTFHALTFTGGVDAEAGTSALISSCQLGEDEAPSSSNVTPTATIRIGGLSSVEFTRSLVTSAASKAAVYCFPHSAATFSDCDIVGVKRQTDEQLKSEKEERDRKKPRGYVAPPPPPPAAPQTVYCPVGIFAEESLSSFHSVCIRNTGIGIYAVGSCPDLQKKGRKLTVDSCNIRQSMTVGVLLDRNTNAVVKESVVSLCNREALVCGDGHPTVRDCLLIGDVRLKKSCVTTGVTDNTIATDVYKVITEEPLFALKGFRQVLEDPTVPRQRKLAASTRVA